MDYHRRVANIVRLRASSELGDTTTYLIGKSAGTKITKRELESTVAALNIDLQSDKSVRVGCRSRRHDCKFERLKRRLMTVIGGDVVKCFRMEDELLCY